MKTFEQYLNENNQFLKSIDKNGAMRDEEFDLDEINEMFKTKRGLPVVFENDDLYYDCDIKKETRKIIIYECYNSDSAEELFDSFGSKNASMFIDVINNFDICVKKNNDDRLYAAFITSCDKEYDSSCGSILSLKFEF